jgi:hypothetical protein
MRLRHLTFLFTLSAASSALFAQSTRVWLSGTGDDANLCSRTAPCKTFAGALGAVADGGEIDILDGGGFGAVTITKNLSVMAFGVTGGLLVSSGNGIVVNNTSGSPINVVLRGLDFNGVNGGAAAVRVLGSSPVNLQLENSRIYGFTNGVNVTTSSSVTMAISNTHISDCLSSGTGITADATGGAVSISVMGSQIHNCATGVNAAGGAKINIKNSNLSQNTTAVTVFDGTSAALLDSNLISACTTAVNVAASGGTARLTNNTITDNTTGLLTAAGGNMISFGNNRMKGNVTNGPPTSNLAQN